MKQRRGLRRESAQLLVGRPHLSPPMWEPQRLAGWLNLQFMARPSSRMSHYSLETMKRRSHFAQSKFFCLDQRRGTALWGILGRWFIYIFIYLAASVPMRAWEFSIIHRTFSCTYWTFSGSMICVSDQGLNLVPWMGVHSSVSDNQRSPAWSLQKQTLSSSPWAPDLSSCPFQSSRGYHPVFQSAKPYFSI